MNQPTIPLAERLRPRSLDQVIGQEHLLGKEGTLRRAITAGVLPSMILWGPPGVGKTTLAFVIAQQLKRPFHTLSAISSGVKEVREVIAKASRQYRPVLFIDEIHRFNKSQQDALLGAVERGVLTLVGATTENPSFEVNPALRSRTQIYNLQALTAGELTALLERALAEDAWLREQDIELEQTEALLQLSGGDARRLLNLLELVVLARTERPLKIRDAQVREVAQQRLADYDKNGEQHYNLISAFIKSVRGSDPNAALYWLARMIQGGEDARFLARRLIILASEDIGLANPTALIMANNCFQAVHTIGFPEARIILSQCTIYLACSPKSNASYLAIREAEKLAKAHASAPVPLHLRNAPTDLMKEQGYGQAYQYAHDYEGHFVPQEFFPDEVKAQALYDPADNKRERSFREQLRAWWAGKYGY